MADNWDSPYSSFNAPDPPLYLAAKRGDGEAVRALIAAFRDDPPTFLASGKVIHNFTPKLQLTAFITDSGDYCQTPLMAACTENHVAVVEILLAADSSEHHIRLFTPNKATALKIACGRCHVRIVELLIQADPSLAHLTYVGALGHTALDAAVNVRAPRTIEDDIVSRSEACAALLRAAGAVSGVEGGGTVDEAKVAPPAAV